MFNVRISSPLFAKLCEPKGIYMLLCFVNFKIKDPGDSRAKQLRITDKGTQTLRAAYQIVEQVDDLFFKNVIKDKVVFDNLLMRLIKLPLTFAGSSSGHDQNSR
nr:hypothetical protein [Mucilaginibacter sp. SP1R1]